MIYDEYYIYINYYNFIISIKIINDDFLYDLIIIIIYNN